MRGQEARERFEWLKSQWRFMNDVLTGRHPTIIRPLMRSQEESDFMKARAELRREIELHYSLASDRKARAAEEAGA